MGMMGLLNVISPVDSGVMERSQLSKFPTSRIHTK